MNKATLFYIGGLLLLVVLALPVRRLVQNDALFAAGMVACLVLLRVIVGVFARRARDKSRYSGKE